MSFIVDLNSLQFQRVLPIVEWCLKNQIDSDKCIRLLEAWYSYPPKEIKDWTLTIPETHVTIFVLKFCE